MSLSQGLRTALMGLLVLWLALASPAAAAQQGPAVAGGAAQRFERALAATRDGRL
jgi:hypothetical protein